MVITKVVILASVYGGTVFVLTTVGFFCYDECLNGDGNEEKQCERKGDLNSRLFHDFILLFKCMIDSSSAV